MKRKRYKTRPLSVREAWARKCAINRGLIPLERFEEIVPVIIGDWLKPFREVQYGPK